MSVVLKSVEMKGIYHILDFFEIKRYQIQVENQMNR